MNDARDAQLAQDMVQLHRAANYRRRITEDFVDNMSDNEFLRQFRFTKEGVHELTDTLEGHLIPNPNNITKGITPLHQVSCTDKGMVQKQKGKLLSYFKIGEARGLSNILKRKNVNFSECSHL